MKKSPVHFLDISDFSKEDMLSILACASACKRSKRFADKKEISDKEMDGKHVALLFEQPSTRTRVSFDVAITSLGGTSILLDANTMQLSKGETLEDTAEILSRYVDGIVIRTLEHDKIITLSKHAHIPVINALTKFSHPCQLIADMLTVMEKKKTWENLVYAWFGPVNNVTKSWIDMASLMGFTLRLVVPECEKDNGYLSSVRGNISILHNAEEGASEVDVMITDTWNSLGDTEDVEKVREKYVHYQVNEALLRRAKRDAIFMHCLPAYRGEEVTATVIDGKQSVVFDEAENRLHAHKAILLHCLKE